MSRKLEFVEAEETGWHLTGSLDVIESDVKSIFGSTSVRQPVTTSLTQMMSKPITVIKDEESRATTLFKRRRVGGVYWCPFTEQQIFITDADIVCVEIYFTMNPSFFYKNGPGDTRFGVQTMSAFAERPVHARKPKPDADFATLSRGLRRVSPKSWKDRRLQEAICSIKTKNRCFYCKKLVSLAVKTAVLDHYIPRSRDGQDDHSNLVLACLDCDKAKKYFLPEAFVKTILPTLIDRRRVKLALYGLDS